jgi:hypothetical protein
VRRLTPVDLKPWTLPFLVLGLILPIVAAVLLAGPMAGMAAGAAVAAVVVIAAARAQFEEAIEVARASDDRYHLLVIATDAIDDPPVVESIAEIAEEGSRTVGGDAEVLVLAPALNRPVSHWLSDLREARMAAQRRLAVSLAALAAARIDARGEVGDTDPVQALEDALRSFPAQEVIFVTAPDAGEKEVAELRRRLDRPLRRLTAGVGATS